MSDYKYRSWPALCEAMKSELFGNILPFWMEVAPDLNSGGYYGFISQDNTIQEKAPKGLVMHARLLWTFSALQKHDDTEAIRAAAMRAWDFLKEKLSDSIHGGFWWQCDSEGAAMDRNKVVYGQAFALYGISEALGRNDNEEMRQIAENLFHLLENHARDPRGGYLEILSEDWSPHPQGRLSSEDIPCHQSMNTNLHVLEAYTAYYRVEPTQEVAEALKSLVRWFCANIYDDHRLHLTLYLNKDGASMKDVDSYGHDIEAAWLLREAAHVLNDKLLAGGIRPVTAALANAALVEGINSEDGGMDYETENGHRNTDRHWWVQAEAIVGFRDQWEQSGDDKWLIAAGKSWEFIDTVISDHENGEWYWGVSIDGEPLNKEKAGLWKTPYHSGRACMELIERTAKDETR